MADETNPTMQDHAENPSPETQNQKPENMIPQSRFNQVNSELNNLKKQLADLQKAKQDSEQSALAEQGKYKELYEATLKDLEPLRSASDEAKRYRERLEADNQARIALIPEEKRRLIPEYDDPVKMGQWLTANAAEWSSPSKPTAPSLDGGAKGSGQPSAVLSDSLENLARIARDMGYDVNTERVAGYVKKPTKLSTNEGDK